MHGIISAVAVAIIAGSAIGVIAGWGLLQRAPWARMLAIILGILNLIQMPFGTALGLVEAVDLYRTRHLLTAGETLLLYTDGITECRGGPEQFDENRLLEAAAAASGTSAARLVATVREAVQRFAPDLCSDDMALLAVRAEP